LFFNCRNLRCVFCQNGDISQDGRDDEVSAAELAAMMLELQWAAAAGLERLDCY